ncbi:MAG: CHAD domain-containing protein [Novosphingobium sp.]
MGDAVRRIADEQIEKAISSIENMDRSDAIHDVRKRCKKLRGLIRLVRPVFEAYHDENAAFRDAARNISGARDAKVMQGICDLLESDLSDKVGKSAPCQIHERFTMQCHSQFDMENTGQRLDETRNCLLEVRDRVKSWDISMDGWQAIKDGLKSNYKRAQHAARQARSCPDGQIFHELRKRVKYHWCHCRLLENIWPEMMIARQHAARQLSDILGVHHDLDVFLGKFRTGQFPLADPPDADIVIDLARGHQARLEEQAWPLLDRLLAQSPKALGIYNKSLWNSWRKAGA